MTSLSAVLPRTPLVRALLPALLASSLMACAAEPAATNSPATPPKSGTPPTAAIKCSAPPPVRDIWALEPMLSKDGLITAEMSREQKEQVIREYIRQKSQTYLNCKEKK